MDVDLKFQQGVEDKNCINDDLYPNVASAIIKIAEKEGYIRYDTCKKMFFSIGNNYLGDLYEIDIRGENAEGIELETNIFMKQMTQTGDNVKLLSMPEVYAREVFVYTELATIFTKLQNEANIPVNERFKLAKIYEENTINAILLENMTKKGFKVYGRTEAMNLQYAKLCVEYLAKFHGLAFGIEKKMPEYFENKIKSLQQPLTIDANNQIFMNNTYELATKKLSPDLKAKTDKWWKIVSEDYRKYLQGTMTEIKCLSHGDFKMNNIMYKEIEGEITEVVAVDYQITHYGSPILDLIYFLFMGTDQIFRKKHLDYIKDHYYASLKKYLEYFEILVEEVYPRKMFEKNFEDCIDYGLMSCLWVLPFTMLSKDEAPDLGDDKIYNMEFKFNDIYCDRIKGVVEDYFK